MTPKIIEKAASLPPWLLGLAGFAVAYALLRPKEAASLAVGAGKAIAGTVTDFAGGIFTGTVDAVTGGIIPATSNNTCCAAIANYAAQTTWGGKMSASFGISLHCPAGDYLKWAASGTVPDYCPITPENKPAKTVTAPGGGIVSGEYGGSFNDGLEPVCDPSGYATCEDWGINYAPTVIPQGSKLITPVAGLRG